ncbi:MAG: glycosyltransferase family 39 protein, partial [Candidatus Saccharimonadales bacterium]
MKRRIVRLWEEWWRQTAGYLAVLILVGGALWWRLGTLVPSLAQPELMARANANSLHKLYQQPLFLPHKMIQYLFMRFGGDGAFWMRSASALFGLLFVIIFYDIVRNWYSRRIALMSSLLLLTSAWFLHFARLGTPDIMYGLSIGLIWIGIRLKSVRAPRIRSILASLIIIVASLYVPGLIWLIVPLIIWQKKHIWYEIKKAPRVIVLAAILGAVICVG